MAQFFGVEDDALAFVPNVTTAVSTVLSCLPLTSGDQVLMTDHTYGAIRIAVTRWAEAAGAEVVTVHVPLAADEDELCGLVTEAVTERTRLAVLDHVTSPTARRLPLVRLVPELQSRGLMVLVDGAHAAGMLDVDLAGVGADFWTGNLHKWCCAPRGTAVLHASPDRRAQLRPLVASWGEPFGFPRSFQDVGTQDLTAWLSAPKALRTLERLDLARVRRHNVELAVAGQLEVARGLGLDPAGLPRDPAVSMQLVPLPGRGREHPRGRRGAAAPDRVRGRDRGRGHQLGRPGLRPGVGARLQPPRRLRAAGRRAARPCSEPVSAATPAPPAATSPAAAATPAARPRRRRPAATRDPAPGTCSSPAGPIGLRPSVGSACGRAPGRRGPRPTPAGAGPDRGRRSSIGSR